MKLLRFAAILFAILFAVSLQFTFAQPSRFATLKYKNSAGDTLNYRLLFPDADTLRKYPLVIFLHGSGERGSDNDAPIKMGS